MQKIIRRLSTKYSVSEERENNMKAKSCCWFVRCGVESSFYSCLSSFHIIISMNFSDFTFSFDVGAKFRFINLTKQNKIVDIRHEIILFSIFSLYCRSYMSVIQRLEKLFHSRLQEIFHLYFAYDLMKDVQGKEILAQR